MLFYFRLQIEIKVIVLTTNSVCQIESSDIIETFLFKTTAKIIIVVM